MVAVVLAYLPALRGGFLLDDNLLLTDNPLIKAPDGLYRFWFTIEPQDYWPMTNTTLWIEWRLWGMNPIGYHVVNLALHIAASLLIWIGLRKLSIPGAFLAALIFAVHPVNVESVAWISQRKNMLVILFFLLSILWYLKADVLSPSPYHFSRPRTGRWYWLSLLAFLLAMLSKGSVAVMPVLLLGIIWWRRTGTVPIFASAKMGLSPSVSRWDIVRTMPFFIIAVVLTGVNLWFQTHGSGEVIRTASFAQRLLGAGGVLWFYLYKALLPLNLVFVYPQWNIQAGNLLWWLPLAAAMILSGVLWQYRRGWSRPLLFAWGFFCVSLLPVLGFTDVGFMKYSLVSDHYQHIAFIGLIALAAAGWSLWRQRVQGRARSVADIVAAIVAGTLTLLTWQQSGIYRDPGTLYRATLQKNPDCCLLYNNLGSILLDEGRVEEAIKYYKQALRIKPDFPEVYNNLGIALAQSGRTQEAIKQYEQSLRLEHNFPQAHNNLGFTLFNLGRIQEAIEHYEQALKMDPNYAEAHNNLGNALAKIGRTQEAVEHYEQALKLNANYAEAHNNLAAALESIGQRPQAIKHYQQALRLKPDYAEAQINLGNALGKLGRPTEAIKYYEEILRLKPDSPETSYNLGLALLEAGRPQEAIEHFEQALRLKSDFAVAHYNLANALINTGRAPEAIEHYEQALRIKPDHAEAHYNLANALINIGQTQEAIKHYEQALRLKPDYALAENNLGLALIKIGRAEEAIKHHEQALRLKPDYAEAHNNLGTTLVNLGRLEEAIEHYEQATRLRPDYAMAYANLARVYARTQRSSQAVAAAQKALDLARSKGQTTLAKQLEDWLKSYRPQNTEK